MWFVWSQLEKITNDGCPAHAAPLHPCFGFCSFVDCSPVRLPAGAEEPDGASIGKRVVPLYRHRCHTVAYIYILYMLPAGPRKSVYTRIHIIAISMREMDTVIVPPTHAFLSIPVHPHNIYFLFNIYNIYSYTYSCLVKMDFHGKHCKYTSVWNLTLYIKFFLGEKWITI
jgi:hypothetical protein